MPMSKGALDSDAKPWRLGSYEIGPRLGAGGMG
jgi:hypothetical protein